MLVSILSDSVESLIGAIYIDQGFNYVEDFILRIWKKSISKSSRPLHSF